MARCCAGWLEWWGLMHLAMAMVRVVATTMALRFGSHQYEL